MINNIGNKMDYWKNGWGLHEIVLNNIKDIILNNNVQTIVEFGSGGSTHYILKLIDDFNLNCKVISFDHNKDYAFKGNHKNLILKIRDIECCTNEQFEEMFYNKQINKKYFINNQKEKKNCRVKNTFYNISDDDLPSDIDLIILDGPSGNGRSLAFLYLINKLSKKYHIVIDDSDHYDFIERCKQINDCEVIIHEAHPEIHKNFNYAIIKNK